MPGICAFETFGDVSNRRKAGLDKSYRGFTRLHTQAAEIFNFPALRLSPLHVIYRSIAAHLWMGWRDGCERRTTVKTKTISAALQVANAPVGVHKIAGVAGLYLKIGERGAGSYFYLYRLGDRRREIGLGSRDKVSLADACKAARRGRSCGTRPRPLKPVAGASGQSRRHAPSSRSRSSRWLKPIFRLTAPRGSTDTRRRAGATLAKFAFPIMADSASTDRDFAHHGDHAPR
jgi:hypothetical protein